MSPNIETIVVVSADTFCVTIGHVCVPSHHLHSHTHYRRTHMYRTDNYTISTAVATLLVHTPEPKWIIEYRPGFCDRMRSSLQTWCGFQCRGNCVYACGECVMCEWVCAISSEEQAQAHTQSLDKPRPPHQIYPSHRLTIAHMCEW